MNKCRNKFIKLLCSIAIFAFAIGAFGLTDAFYKGNGTGSLNATEVYAAEHVHDASCYPQGAALHVHSGSSSSGGGCYGTYHAATSYDYQCWGDPHEQIYGYDFSEIEAHVREEHGGNGGWYYSGDGLNGDPEYTCSDCGACYEAPPKVCYTCYSCHTTFSTDPGCPHEATEYVSAYYSTNCGRDTNKYYLPNGSVAQPACYETVISMVPTITEQTITYAGSGTVWSRQYLLFTFPNNGIRSDHLTDCSLNSYQALC